MLYYCALHLVQQAERASYHVEMGDHHLPNRQHYQMLRSVLVGAALFEVARDVTLAVVLHSTTQQRQH